MNPYYASVYSVGDLLSVDISFSKKRRNGTEIQSNRCVLHIDLDCFYAQAEIVNNPSLKGRPVGILQNQTISTCNYEARKYGIKKMTHRNQAKAMCPDLVIIPANMDLYRNVSTSIQDHLSSLSSGPLERAGIDEVYIDVTEEVATRIASAHHNNWKLATKTLVVSSSERNDNDDKEDEHAYNVLCIGSQIAEELRKSIFEKFGYESSAGIAHNKFLAKLASAMNKPNGQTMITKSGIPKTVDDLAVGKIPKVGRKMEQQLNAIGVYKIADIQRIDYSKLATTVDATFASSLLEFAQGIDPSPVVPSGPVKSVGVELTFLPADSEAKLLERLRPIVDNLIQRLALDEKRNNRHVTAIRIAFAENDFRSKFTSKSGKFQFTAAAQASSNKTPRRTKSDELLAAVLSMFKAALQGRTSYKITRFSITACEFASNNRTSASGGMSTIDSFFKQCSSNNNNNADANNTPPANVAKGHKGDEQHSPTHSVTPPQISDSKPAPTENDEEARRQQEEQDYLLALKLHQQEMTTRSSSSATTNNNTKTKTTTKRKAQGQTTTTTTTTTHQRQQAQAAKKPKNTILAYFAAK